MTELETSKNTLISKLFELSRVAQDTADAVIGLYKHMDEESDIKGVLALGESVDLLLEKSMKKKEKDLIEKEKKMETEGKKKKKTEKDPNAPKKPLTIYFAFSFATRELIREERKKKNLTALSAIEMNDMIKERWNNITKEEKKKWQEKYADELKLYQEKKMKYSESLNSKSNEEFSKLSEVEDNEENVESADPFNKSIDVSTSSMKNTITLDNNSSHDKDLINGAKHNEKKKEKKRKSEKNLKSEKKMKNKSFEKL